MHHILVVESIRADGNATVIYSVGDNPAENIKRGWRRLQASVSGSVLTIPGVAEYQFFGSGNLIASFKKGVSRGALTKTTLADLTKAGSTIPWTGGRSEFLDTDLVEDGKAIRLEAIVAKPSGSGPFPLAIFNHGSTGTGRNGQLFAQSWWSPEIAKFLVDRGWMVAFPQRRGRGRSGGLYDEGFAADRSQGYACDSERSLPGADRALADIDAAVEALRRRADVAAKPILVGGQSRGGVLAIAYAGKHAEKVAGALNFVGGWQGQACSNAATINGTLFRMGAAFDRSTLWLYGDHDPFYTLDHSRGNFAAFQQAKGKGEFFQFEVPGTESGHSLVYFPQLWSDKVEAYLRQLERSTSAASSSEKNASQVLPINVSSVETALTRNQLKALLVGKTVKWSDGGQGYFSSRGLYRYTFNKVVNEGTYRVYDGFTCLEFKNGFSRCDDWYRAGAGYFMKTRQGLRFEVLRVD
ncbi:alpha/beta hydrolase family protein [Bradyrhizobium ivorense]|uniref:alpha/beta hydrolase family protein n=1 Tax=Bradyrhizobium ivorense TaxID=2511166 RepID=UPI00155A65AF|nr:alpha/beta hydrolase [Bradyrhizobium ivorense]